MGTISSFDIPSSTSLSNLLLTDTGDLKIAGSITLENIISHEQLQKAPIIPELELEKDIIRLRKELFAQTSKPSEKSEFDRIREELLKKEFKKDLLFRISSEMQRHVLSEEKIYSLLSVNKQIPSSVLSIDIRKSSAMMLKTTSENYFSFIRELMETLIDYIKRNYGIFEKFTGDGLIAFFPREFTGKDAIFHTVKAAQQCVHFFSKYLEKTSKIFGAILDDFGLCAGIDYGNICVYVLNTQINIVGTPVVYACRMSGHTKNSVVINNGAKAEMANNPSYKLELDPIVVDVKHEGKLVGYLVKTDVNSLNFKKPTWLT